MWRRILLTALLIAAACSPDDASLPREESGTSVATGVAPTATADPVAPTADSTPTVAADPSPASGDPSSEAPTSAFRATVDYNVDAPELPVGTMQWVSRIDVDPSVGYGLLATRAQAEPGDLGCFEFLELEGKGYQRDTDVGPRDAPFAEAEEYTPDAGIVATVAGALALTVDSLPVLATATPSAAGATFDEWAIDLDARELQEVLALVPNMGGVAWDADGGRLGVRAGLDGRLTELTVESDGRDGQTLRVHVQYGPFSSAADGVDENADRNDVGVCVAEPEPWLGRWTAVSIIADGAAAPLESPLSDGHLTLLADGTLSGSTGCRSFDGRATFGYMWLEDVELTTSGEPCTGADADWEAWILDALGSDPNLTTWESNLLIGSEDGVAVMFAPA